MRAANRGSRDVECETSETGSDVNLIDAIPFGRSRDGRVNVGNNGIVGDLGGDGDGIGSVCGESDDVGNDGGELGGV